MVSLQSVYVITAGMIGGLVASWVIDVRKEVTPLFIKLNVDKKYIPTLEKITEVIIALLIILIMLLMVD